MITLDIDDREWHWVEDEKGMVISGIATVLIGGASHHLEALRIGEDGEILSLTDAYKLDHAIEIAGVDEQFQHATIRGKKHLMLLTPYSD